MRFSISEAKISATDSRISSLLVIESFSPLDMRFRIFVGHAVMFMGDTVGSERVVPFGTIVGVVDVIEATADNDLS
ncbi:unnamed protein product [Gongylonema pulchrum]|uniref:ATP-synt_ab_N domain-containing protein n=1 Tax=Gongylonema pulchrum TaxID=637853 RepID=A0A183EPW4_9BILA|nr:unnamed protein product [Gongylonema pulchrum]